jgi:hypothetical protein
MSSSTDGIRPTSFDADAAVIDGKPAPSARVPLSRDRIIGAAITFVDEQGLRDLTMRRLGATLGVEAMSLYRYVPGAKSFSTASSRPSSARCTTTRTS